MIICFNMQNNYSMYLARIKYLQMAYNLGTTLYWITLYSNRSTTNETYLHCQFTTVFNVQLMKCFNVFIHKCNWNKYKVLLSLFNKAWNKTKRKLL